MTKEVKKYVVGVFDEIARNRAWESLYSRTIESGEIGRSAYNFVSRRRAVTELLAPHARGRLLDIGCGTGDLAPHYVRCGVQYCGVDLSAEMIERATANYHDLVCQKQASFQVADCEQIPFADGEFDVVTAVALIEYLPDCGRALDEIVRVTKPGGMILITVPYKKCINKRLRLLFRPAVRLLMPLYARLKRQPLLAMKDVTHYDYDEPETDGMMSRRQCNLMRCTYTNFHVVPFGLDQVIPRTYVSVSEWVDRGGRAARWRRWASNYIALYEKKK